MLPKIALDQTNGDVAVAWYDARNDVGGGPNATDIDGTANTDVTLFASWSFERRWHLGDPNVAVADAPTDGYNHNGGQELGDYIGAAFHDGIFYPSWADSSNSTGDNPDGDLWRARRLRQQLYSIENDPPVAVDDAYSTNEGVPLNVPAPGVLANDTDPQNDALTATIATPADQRHRRAATPTVPSLTRRRSTTSSVATRSPTPRQTGNSATPPRSRSRWSRPFRRCASPRREQYVGTPGNDVLQGTPNNDVICGLGGDDDDQRRAPVRTSLIGGSGNDTVHGGSGNDTISGRSGDDLLFGEAGNDSLDGGSGNDLLNGGPGNDSAVGGPGNDQLIGEGGNDVLNALDGVNANDSAAGDSGTDSCTADPGDTVTGCP